MKFRLGLALIARLLLRARPSRGIVDRTGLIVRRLLRARTAPASGGPQRGIVDRTSLNALAAKDTLPSEGRC